jgi:hypothetical protein
VTSAPESTPRISAAVMAHPSRLPQARALRDRYPELGLEIITDNDPERRHSRDTARRAWAAATPYATHHLVVQDDIELADDFAARMLAAVSARPDQALSFFAEWGSRTAGVVRLAALEGANWATIVDGYVPTQAVVMPAEAARGYAESAIDPDQPDDVALARWLTAEGITALVSVPNLVQHLDLPSLTGNTYQGPRRSVCFGPAAGFAPDGYATDGLAWLPHLSWMRAESGCFTLPSMANRNWKVELTAQFLADRLGEGQASAALAATLAADPALAGLREYVGAVTLWAVWLTGYALGVLRAERDPVAEPVPGGPVVAAALASLAPGGLRRFLAGPLLERLADPFTRLVTEAILCGAEAQTA